MKKRIAQRVVWPLVSHGSVWLAGVAVNRLRRRMRGRPRRDRFAQALVWTAAMGALAGTAEMLAARGAERLWRRASGRRPPRTA